MASSPEMSVKKSINIFRVFIFRKCSQNLVLRTRLVCLTYYIPQLFSLQVRTYIISSDFQSKSELYTTRNCLLLTVEIIVVLQFRYMQQLQILALQLDIEGYMPLLLYGIVFLRRIGDFNGESLILNRLRKLLLFEAPCKLMDDAE